MTEQISENRTISILGSGWLGLPLAAYLVQADYHVKASTRHQARIAEIESSGAEAFIIDIDALTDQLHGFLDADILIINITSKNIEGFRALAAAIADSPVSQVMFVSSTSVYDNVKKTVTELDVEFHSDSPLLVIEELLTGSQTFSTTLLRFGGLIDRRRHPGRFFSSGRSVQNADTPVNLIHFDDCLGIIDAIIEQERWGEVFNACADSHPSKREFYRKAIKHYGGSMPEFVDSDGSVGKTVSNDKVKKMLGYEFQHPDLMAISFD